MLLNATNFCSLEELLLRSRTPAMLLSIAEILHIGDLLIKQNRGENKTRALVNTEVNM
jgi:hypothetical protein